MPEKNDKRADLHVFISRELRMEFKYASERQGLTMQDSISEMMRRFIEWEKSQRESESSDS